MPIANHEGHIRLTAAERAVLRLVAEGMLDEEIALQLGQTVRAVRGTLHRFHERAGLGGRRTVAWAVRHSECCLAEPQPA